MKTIQELEKEKLQEEVNLLKARIAKEFPERKPKSRWEKMSSFFQKWYTVILALSAVFGGFWGIFYPVKTYLNEQQKAVQYTISGDMIDALKDLEANDENTRANSLIILSYYDLNAIPILLNKYTIQQADAEDSKQDYIEAISLIYSRKQAGIIDVILIRTRKNFNLFKEYANKNDWRINNQINGLINLLELIENLDLTNRDEKKVERFYSDIIDDLKNNNAYSEIDGVSVFESKMKKFIKDGN